MKKFKSILKNTFITVSILAVSLSISIMLQDDLGIPEHVTTTIAFAVFLISVLTRGYVYGIIAAVIGQVVVHWDLQDLHPPMQELPDDGQ